MKIQIINGPNLNLLGQREQDHYGLTTLAEIEDYTQKLLPKNIQIEWFQSNTEGAIIDKIHACLDSHDALIINPAGYSHTSVAILDALKIFKKPIAEVHLSNVYAREDFRQRMLTAQAASFIMSGLGKDVYIMAIDALMRIKE
jgi:3-dehydroquinate dehydratase-2